MVFLQTLSLAKESLLLTNEIPRVQTKMSVTSLGCLWSWRKLPPRKRWAPEKIKPCWWLNVVPLPTCFNIDALRKLVVPNKRLGWSWWNLLFFEDEITFWEKRSWILWVSLILGSVSSWTVQHKNPNIFALWSLCRRDGVGMVLGCDLVNCCNNGVSW